MQERELAESLREVARKMSVSWPSTANIYERLAREYDQEADWMDQQADLRKRTAI
jgi:hypothetical protein